MQQIPGINKQWPAQGGINAGLMRGEDGKPDYYLIISTDPIGFNKSLPYGGYGVEVDGANFKFDGQANTIALLKSETTHPAAEFAASVIIEGHNDFYLMSIQEEALARANCPELFENKWYWSSTQYSACSAWSQTFVDGSQGIFLKLHELAVRAVRRYYPLSNSTI